MSEKIRTVRAIGILEGLLERFRDAARVAHVIPTSSENERDAIQMQRQGRREAWEDAARAVREALGEHRIALEAEEVERRDLRASEERVAVERDAARQDARDLRAERDGRGERIKQLVGDLERATAEKGEAVRLLEIANRERDKARERAAELRVELDQAKIANFEWAQAENAARAERDKANAENKRLLGQIGASVGRLTLQEIGRELRRRAENRQPAGAPQTIAEQAKLKCAAILVLEVALGPMDAVRAVSEIARGEEHDKLESWERKASGPGGASDAMRIRRVEPVTLSVAAQREIAWTRAELADVDASRVWDAKDIRDVLTRLLDALPKPVVVQSRDVLTEIGDQIIAIRDRVSAGEVHAKSGIIRHLEDAWMLLKFSTEIPALPPRKS